MSLTGYNALNSGKKRTGKGYKGGNSISRGSSSVFADPNFKVVDEPTRVGSYGTIFYKQTGKEGLKKNMDKVATEMYVKSVRDGIQPPRPQEFHEYARQNSLL